MKGDIDDYLHELNQPRTVTLNQFLHIMDAKVKNYNEDDEIEELL